MARIDLSQNEFMERFVGQDHIDSNDVQFWYQLLSCSFNFMRVQDPKVVDKTLEPYIVRLILNNSQSFNIGSLIRVFLDRVSRVKSQSGQSTNPYYVFQSFNALYLIRSICKSYIETSSEEQLIKTFRAKIDVEPKVSQLPLPPIPPGPPGFQGPPQFPAQQPEQQPVQSQLSVQAHTQQTNGVSSPQPEQSLPPLAGEPMNNNAQVSSPEVIAPNERQEPTKKADMTPGSTMLDQYISTLIAILVDIPQNDSTYLLQVEAINALLVLLSVQMYSTAPASQSVVYRSLMQKRCSIHALILTKTLLNNFIHQQPMPQESGSIIIGLASGLWKVLTLGYGVQEEEENEKMPLLAKQSLMLLNILTNHYTTDKNPYREAIVSCQDSRYNLSDPTMAVANSNNDAMASATTSKSALTSNSIKVDFHELFETICKHMHDDQVALLLYLLLHSNKIFRPYILTTAASELDRLIIPLLKILYSSIEKGSHHVYMVLIIFIILSEEAAFNGAIHKITVRGLPWFKDRLLSEISLGSLTALIIVRSFQYNALRIKDKFLHTNLFATLANLSNHFQNLHPYVCQRVVDLLERLSRRYLAATKPASSSPLSQMQQTLEVFRDDNPLAKALATDTHRQDIQDASSIELDSTTTNQIVQQNGSTVNICIPEPQVLSQGGNAVASALGNNNLILPPVDAQGQECLAGGQQSPNSNSTSDHVNISIDDSKQDLDFIEEVIRMLLEVINNSLATQVIGNPDLIYTLLYKRNIFNSLLSSHQSFYNMVINVERILTYFYNQIESYERQLTVEEIKELIESASKEWNFDQNKSSNSRLLFHYVEDEQPEEFFIPYIWTRIYYSSGIVWNSKRIALFNPDEM